MRKDVAILVAENDEEHFELIRRNLLRAGIYNEILHLADGRETLDFLIKTSKGPTQEHKDHEYILLLDIRMAEVEGVEVLEKVKKDKQLSKIPVIILTAVDDPHTIGLCYNLGCNTYIVKSTEHEKFEETVQKLGHFLSVVEIASIR
jgi:two-component system response regulator